MGGVRTMNRICVLTHQRTGSTYMCELLQKVISDNNNNCCCNFGELFNASTTNILLRNPKTGEYISNALRNEMDHDFIFEHNLETLMRMDKQFPFVLKLFPGPIEQKQRLIFFLRTMDVDFIWLKRDNMEEYFLSFLLARDQDRFHDHEYNKNTIPIERALQTFDECLYIHRHFNEWMTNIFPIVSDRLHIVTYETMANNLSTIFNKQIQTDISSKQAKKNHYQYIENEFEIRSVLHQYLEKNNLTKNAKL